MRKVLSVLMLSMTLTQAANAQGNATVSIEKEPVFFPESDSSIPILGVNPNGKFIFGSYAGTAFIYDTEKNSFRYMGSEGSETEVNGITAAGDVLVTEGMETRLEHPGGSEPYILSSPMEDHPMVKTKYITPDGAFVVGFFSDDAYDTAPFIMTRKGDGTFESHILDVPEKDGLGLKPQWCTAHFCTDDGKYAVGRLCENLGNNFELLVWVRGDDGKYTLTRPTLSYFFNTDAPEPGPEPKWEDYVSVDRNDPAYKEQEAAFKEAFDKWMKACNDRKKPYSLDAFDLVLSSSGEAIMGALQETVETNGDEESILIYPYYLNLRTGESKAFPEYKGYKALNLLWDGGLLTQKLIPTSYEGYYLATACVAYPGNGAAPVPFTDWLKDRSGKDFSEAYTVERPDMGVEKQVVTGYPYLSADGRTMAFCGVPPTSETSALFANSFMVFGESITTDTTTGISTAQGDNGATKACFDNGVIRVPGGTACSADIYTPAGMNVARGLKADAEGKIAIPEKCKGGVYIVNLNAAGKRSTIKIVL